MADGYEQTTPVPRWHMQIVLWLCVVLIPIAGVILNHILPWKPRAGDVLHDPIATPVIGQQIYVTSTYPPYMAAWLLQHHGQEVNTRNMCLMMMNLLPGAAALILVDLYSVYYFVAAPFYMVFYFLKFVAVYVVWCASMRLFWPYMFPEETSTVKCDVPRYRQTWNWIYVVFTLNIGTNTMLAAFLLQIVLAKAVGVTQQTAIVIALQLVSSADKFFVRLASYKLGLVAQESRRLRLDLRNSMLYYYEAQVQLMLISALPFLLDYSIMAVYLFLESATLVVQSLFDAEWFRRFLKLASDKLWPGHSDFLELIFGISGETRVASMQLLFLNCIARSYAALATLASGAIIRYGPQAAYWLKSKNAYSVLTYPDYEKNIAYLFLCFGVAAIHGVASRFVMRKIYGLDLYTEGMRLLYRYPVTFVLAGCATLSWAY